MTEGFTAQEACSPTSGSRRMRRRRHPPLTGVEHRVDGCALRVDVPLAAVRVSDGPTNERRDQHPRPLDSGNKLGLPEATWARPSGRSSTGDTASGRRLIEVPQRLGQQLLRCAAHSGMASSRMRSAMRG